MMSSDDITAKMKIYISILKKYPADAQIIMQEEIDFMNEQNYDDY